MQTDFVHRGCAHDKRFVETDFVHRDCAHEKRHSDRSRAQRLSARKFSFRQISSQSLFSRKTSFRQISCTALPRMKWPFGLPPLASIPLLPEAGGTRKMRLWNSRTTGKREDQNHREEGRIKGKSPVEERDDGPVEERDAAHAQRPRGRRI